MRIPGSKTAKTLYRWLRARLQGGALILGYHRITDISGEGYGIGVSPAHFAEQMDVLRQHANIISVQGLIQCLREGSVPHRSIAVTFDDGYADNLYQAKPILESYDIPATIFVCSGFAGREFWWDEVQRLVMYTAAEPQELQTGIDLLTRKQRLVSQEAGIGFTSVNRKALSQTLYHYLLPLDIPERNHAMDIIRSWAQVSGSGLSTQRSMNHAELVQLSKCELIEIGSHTRNHPMLHHLTLERQREEIVWGRQDLESVIGRPVAGFSYPNGRATEDAKNILREHRFSYACTSLEDVVRPTRDRFELTRFWQKDVDGDAFLRGLKLWWKENKS